MSDRKVGKVASIIGKAALDLAGELGGGNPTATLVLTGFGALARKMGSLLENGHSVDELLRGMAKIPDIRKEWRDTEDTARETPGSKKGG